MDGSLEGVQTEQDQFGEEEDHDPDSEGSGIGWYEKESNECGSDSE